MDFSRFSNIAPYRGKDFEDAIERVLDKREYLGAFVSMLVGGNDPASVYGYLSHMLEAIRGVRSYSEFQKQITAGVFIPTIIGKTMESFSDSGSEKIDPQKGHVFLSNHRDIILDCALLDYTLLTHGKPLCEMAFGDNLMTSQFIEDLFRLNGGVIVRRGLGMKEKYLSTLELSEYFVEAVTKESISIWLAQRQGRTKDGADITEQGLLKMLDMSGTSDFRKNFEELNIIPMSISYEIEPCDVLKARELLISRTQKYVKAPGEDLNSILTGIKQQKGNIHLSIGKPLTSEEIAVASLCDKNDRYQLIRHAVDLRVIEGYRLWKTNYLAYDIVNKTTKYSDKYTVSDIDWFTDYIEHQLDTVEKELDRDDLKHIFLHIYANPVVSKEMLREKNTLPGWKSQK